MKQARLVKKRVSFGEGWVFIVATNFWGNSPEVAKLRGELSDLLLFSGIDAIADKCEKIVTEITALATVREKDILE